MDGEPGLILGEEAVSSTLPTHRRSNDDEGVALGCKALDSKKELEVANAGGERWSGGWPHADTHCGAKGSKGHDRI